MDIDRSDPDGADSEPRATAKAVRKDVQIKRMEGANHMV